MSNCESGFETRNAAERTTLRAVLVLNAGLALGLAVGGWLCASSAVMAIALDNASDAAVYAIGYYAVGRAAVWKVRAARVSGLMLLLLAFGVIGDVLRRWLFGSEPLGLMIMSLSAVAAVVNFYCIRLLARHQDGDVNMRAARTFSDNDMISNIGVLLSGGLVMVLGRSWPDLVMGLIVAMVAAKGGVEILRDAQQTAAEESRHG